MIQTISNQHLNRVYEDTRIKTPLSRNERALQLAKWALIVIGFSAAIYVAYRCGSKHENPEIEQLKKDIERLNSQKLELENQLRLKNELVQSTRNCETGSESPKNVCENNINLLTESCKVEKELLKSTYELRLSLSEDSKTFCQEYYQKELALCEQRSQRYEKLLLDDLRSNRTITQVGAVNPSGTAASVFLELWAKFLEMYQ